MIHYPPDENRSQLVLAELAQILFYQPLITFMFCQIIVVGVMTAFFWDIVPAFELLIWTIYMVFLSITFMLTTYLYRRTPAADRNLQHWIKLFPLAGTLLGAGWGSISLWPNAMQDSSNLVFLLLMPMGMAAAGIATLGPYLRSFVAYASLITLSFVSVLFLHGSKLHFSMGVMVLVYLVVILISAYHMKRAVRQSISLRLEKLELVEELVEKNTQAEQAREHAEQADISKSKFLAAASHDLRQPLHALGLFVDALESRITYPEVRSIVDNIRISTDALGDLFNALLDISKLDAGVLEPKLVDLQLRPMLQRIQTDYSELARSKSLDLRIVDCGFVVHTDPAMLERILRNLVSNAIRYTQQGSVLLGCRRRGNQVRIEIHDTGVGIAAAELDQIFEEFYQIKNPERDRRKGLGLGLAIVKRLTNLLDYPLKVSSVPNKGSVFRVTVPYVASLVSAATPQQSFVEDVKGSRVLIIDDEAMIRLGTRQVLEQWGCVVIEAESIEQALELIKDNCAIDIILTDYRLRKNTTGLDAIAQIHATCGNHIPAIILTGDTDPQRLREARDSSFRLLHKPVSPAKLRSLMSYLLDQNQTD